MASEPVAVGCLQARPQEELTIGGTTRVLVSSLRARAYVSEIDSLYQQLQWGCGLEGFYVQAPAMGETGVQGQLWSRLSVYIRVCSHVWTSILLSQRGEQDEAVDALCVRVSVLSVCLCYQCV